MVYLLFLVALVDVSYCIGSSDAPEASVNIKGLMGTSQKLEQDHTASNNSSSLGECNGQAPSSQATENRRLFKVPMVKRLANVKKWVKSRKYPNLAFRLTSCNCQNFYRLYSFLSKYPKCGVRSSRIQAIPSSGMIQMIAPAPDDRKSPSKCLCIKCYQILLYSGIGQTDLLLKKNKFGDLILCLPGLESRQAQLKKDSMAESGKSSSFRSYLSSAFESRDYLPFVMKYYWDEERVFTGKFAIPASENVPLPSGVARDISAQKKLVNDALGSWSNIPYFELTEDPIGFLERMLASKRLSQDRHAVANGKEQANKMVREVDGCAASSEAMFSPSHSLFLTPTSSKQSLDARCESKEENGEERENGHGSEVGAIKGGESTMNTNSNACPHSRNYVDDDQCLEESVYITKM